jgi:hypothetical protein
MSANPMCCKKVYGSSFLGHMCQNKGAYEHEGKPYCKLHHPPTILAKDEARNAAFKADRARVNEARNAEKTQADEQKRRADLYPELLAALIGMVKSYEHEHEAGASNPSLLAAFAAIAAATGKPGEQT